MRVIVGDAGNPTPALSTRITHVVLNPYWNVPQDLVRTRLAPAAARSDGRSLTEAGYEVMSGWSDDAVPVRPDSVDWVAVAAGVTRAAVRQKPGPGNAMGRAKFVMPNDSGIYLHDTPARHLFATSGRALSAGCVRVEDYQALLDFIVPSLSPISRGDRPVYVGLATPVPVYLIPETPSQAPVHP